MSFESRVRAFQADIDAINEQIEANKDDAKKLKMALKEARAELRTLALTGVVQDTIPFQNEGGAPLRPPKGQPVSP